MDSLAITPEQADAAKSKYAKLHTALFQAMSNEKTLLDDAKQLKRKVDVSLLVESAELMHQGMQQNGGKHQMKQ